MANIFTTRFLIVMALVLLVSSVFSYTFLGPKQPTAATGAPQHTSNNSHQDPAVAVMDSRNADQLIDQALEHSLNGAYDQSFPILKQLSDNNVTRAKLYLAVAYYHGHGVPKSKSSAKTLLLELQEKNYEMGIVNTYLNLIAYSEEL